MSLLLSPCALFTHVVFGCLLQIYNSWSSVLLLIKIITRGRVCCVLNHTWLSFPSCSSPRECPERRGRRWRSELQHPYLFGNDLSATQTLDSSTARPSVPISNAQEHFPSVPQKKSPGAAARTTGAEAPLSFVGAIVGGCVLGLGV